MDAREKREEGMIGEEESLYRGEVVVDFARLGGVLATAHGAHQPDSAIWD